MSIYIELFLLLLPTEFLKERTIHGNKKEEGAFCTSLFGDWGGGGV